MLYTSRLKEILLREKLVNKQNIDLYEIAAKKEKLSLEKYILNHKIISEEKLYKTVAEYFKLPTVDLKTIIIHSSATGEMRQVSSQALTLSIPPLDSLMIEYVRH